MTRLRWTAVDALVWAVALTVATSLRLDFGIPTEYYRGLVLATAVAFSLQVAIGWVWGPYAVRHELGSFEEVGELARATAVTGVVLAAAVVGLDAIALPRSVPVTATVLALGGMFAARFVVRARATRRVYVGRDSRRAVVFGAGGGGRMLVRSLVSDPGSGIRPVALLDDDHTKQRLSIAGVKVRGRREHLAEVARRTDADTLVIAVPTAPADLVRELSAAATNAGLSVLVLPAVREIFGGRPTASDLRDLDVADLLGRQPIELDMAAISEQLSGRRVLVTGAGGSIGSELCRQIARFFPGQLFMLDHDESGLHATQMSIEGHALLDSDSLVLCDIRDADSLREVFERTRPDVVFHAAALKHLTMLERHPAEALKSNVLGTRNVLDAARHVGVSTFVNISTDKAANPQCVLGWSKRVAERLTAAADAQEPEARYISVRFGNVLGSRGSVVIAFTEQIRSGGPVTITHPDVERYFMLIPEACQLVLQAASIGDGGEVMVLDMGTPVKITDMARTMIHMSGRTDVEIVYTGLRPGEKLSEELFTPGEAVRASSHPLITTVEVPGLECDTLDLPAAHDVRSWLVAYSGTSQVSSRP
ncbi:polysaccharide biosynthesis protein [Phycicoccus sp. MAQZ13P-2]|uniref:polysaccharide biosynthesis protein n=1 Tax=Phycicoccus mangrovi TaxID=2840470 RepID=UPI001C00558C|nr:nucleoside-diphosphate sugar epimerase/dehydratase [Phycicoccus mangrovi]MBT9257615.1 polysaccharide biosynthesis protein [Phycicoccus mangrovi]MBT9276054.1 polysaccharide biosynthesis protein [Phycicoccus mangrovi]